MIIIEIFLSLGAKCIGDVVCGADFTAPDPLVGNPSNTDFKRLKKDKTSRLQNI